MGGVEDVEIMNRPLFLLDGILIFALVLFSQVAAGSLYSSPPFRPPRPPPPLRHEVH